MSTIYFPSCNFTKASPEAAKRLRAYMQEKMPVRLLKAFPNARSERYNEALEKIREKIGSKRKRKAGDK